MIQIAELYANEIKGEGAVSGEQFVDECQVESDLELLLPANYVTGSSERMLLYRELDGLTLDKDVEALGQNVLTSVKPSQLMVKIVHDELASLMGGTAVDVNLQGNPAIILMSVLPFINSFFLRVPTPCAIRRNSVHCARRRHIAPNKGADNDVDFENRKIRVYDRIELLQRKIQNKTRLFPDKDRYFIPYFLFS